MYCSIVNVELKGHHKFNSISNCSQSFSYEANHSSDYQSRHQCRSLDSHSRSPTPHRMSTHEFRWLKQQCVDSGILSTRGQLNHTQRPIPNLEPVTCIDSVLKKSFDEVWVNHEDSLRRIWYTFYGDCKTRDSSQFSSHLWNARGSRYSNR